MNKAYFYSQHDMIKFPSYLNVSKKKDTRKIGQDFGSSKIRQKLLSSEQIIFNFRFEKIGDSLLALIGSHAIIDYLKLQGINELVEKIYCGNHFDLISNLSDFKRFKYQKNFIINDKTFVISDSNECLSDINLLPEQTHIYKSTKNSFFSSLPQRYYLYIEDILKTRLKLTDLQILEKKFTFCDNRNFSVNKDCINIGFITSTTLKERKSYPFYPDLLLELSQRIPKNVDFYWFKGGDNSTFNIRKKKVNGSWVNIIENGSLVENAKIFSQLDLVVGNDTGLTHLSAMSQFKNQIPNVLGLYNRHSLFKWNTGYRNHYCVATPFSYIIGRKDLCPVREKLDERDWRRSSSFNNIPSKIIAKYCIEMELYK